MDELFAIGVLEDVNDKQDGGCPPSISRPSRESWVKARIRRSNTSKAHYPRKQKFTETIAQTVP